ncbi:MAG TPA: S8 family serine peptidase [Mycobacteriales bacterium]|nr:S8 family serine peptidase [Mycobacteriales bacterium]
MRTRVGWVALLLTATAVTGGTVALAAPAPAPTLAPAPGPAPTHQVTAVVTYRGQVPVRASGVALLDAFPRVGAELVRATPTALARLARDPRVLGIAPDSRLRVAGHDDSSGSGVLAPDTLGGTAGTPHAGAGVNIALLDTGVSDTAALSRDSGRITDGVDVSQLAQGGPALTSGQFTDGYGHGTFLASLIAGGQVPGSGNRALGVAPAARIVVVKVADNEGNTSLSEVLAGLDWVAAHARAINIVTIALAQPRPQDAYGADPLTAAIEHVRAAGVLPVVAAGNTAGQLTDPGLDPFALTVGAADTTLDTPAVADFSGSGVAAGVAKPDLVAAGVGVLGLLSPDSVIAQAHPQGWQPDGLFRGSGTSEATAIASGAAAVFLSEHPDASVRAVKASLRAAAEPLDGDNAAAGAGLLALADRVEHGAVAAGEANFDPNVWAANAWLGGSWEQWLSSSWSSSSWSSSSWSDQSWGAGS